jgi:hypothetical protein
MIKVRPDKWYIDYVYSHFLPEQRWRAISFLHSRVSDSGRNSRLRNILFLTDFVTELF